MPTALWLWDILYMTCRLVVIHHQVIRQITWNPQNPDMLATSCGGNDVLLIKRPPPHSENLSIKACKCTTIQALFQSVLISLLQPILMFAG